MDKPIDSTMHGVADYATVMTTAAAPHLLGFSKEASRVCAALATGYMGLSLLTDYRLSAKPVVPFRVHGVLEAVTGLALPFLPRLPGFPDDHRGRNFLVGLAALTFVVASLTDWDDDGE